MVDDLDNRVPNLRIPSIGDSIADMASMVGYPTFLGERLLFGGALGLLLAARPGTRSARVFAATRLCSSGRVSCCDAHCEASACAPIDDEEIDS
ncbi:hypothetical protein BOX37_03450 [Nocardia mangyaensis]|uniref:Uncharacterized protein n=1 Tax=Nocardia mangyaensis TaxID=2213200 RepID=A0A1J0VME1_9NOCA|nr:hypothetical protein [Nocardia mangyaensis]APE33175.1 hypothetical protein BOX37_03450 [Nocardia mangyaensis]